MNPLYALVLPLLVTMIIVLGVVVAPWLVKRLEQHGAETPVERDD